MLRKDLIKKGNKNRFFNIVLAGVSQLYAYVSSSLLKNQSIVVRLEKRYVFFFIMKRSQRIGAGKNLFGKISQCTRAKKIYLDKFEMILD